MPIRAQDSFPRLDSILERLGDLSPIHLRQHLVEGIGLAPDAPHQHRHKVVLGTASALGFAPTAARLAGFFSSSIPRYEPGSSVGNARSLGICDGDHRGHSSGAFVRALSGRLEWLSLTWAVVGTRLPLLWATFVKQFTG